MTVDKLIKELLELQKQGKGNYLVIHDSTCCKITLECFDSFQEIMVRR